MKTYFAPTDRATEAVFQRDIELISNNPVIHGLLNAVSGLFAILNSERQVLSVNATFLDALGVENVEQILGLRPGETLNCVHAHHETGGCGTSRYCSTCGAVVSIMTALETGDPAEELCFIETERNGRKHDLYFKVRSFPIDFEKRRMILLFLQDVTHQQRLSGLESVFFHDISNLVTGLLASSKAISRGSEEKRRVAAERVKTISDRLAHEIRLQRALVLSDVHKWRPEIQELEHTVLFNELRIFFASHPQAQSRKIVFTEPKSSITLNIDLSMVFRISCNMILNALEASEDDDEVRVSIQSQDQEITIAVWNRGTIPEEIARRIFQRNFSTKGKFGRGLGTYSMKLLGENLLGGRVTFTSDNTTGTEFRFRFRA